jgi:hypothetical protein
MSTTQVDGQTAAALEPADQIDWTKLLAMNYYFAQQTATHRWLG